MWTKAFWKDAIERMVKTGAQSILVAISAVSYANGDVTFEGTLLGVGIGVGLSMGTSLLSSLIGNPRSASALPIADQPAPVPPPGT